MRLRRAVTHTAACTAATALLTVAAGAGSASAATSDLQYRSTTDTGVVQLVLRLPGTVPALPGVPNPLVLTLLGTDAQGFHGAGSADVATAHSYLAGGSLVTDSALAAVLGSLNRVVTSDLAHPGTTSATALSVPSNPLGLGLNVIAQQATTRSADRSAASSSNLTNAFLGSLRSLGLGTALDTSLAQLDAALATITSGSAALTSALSALPALPTVTVPNPLQPVLGGTPTITTPTLSGTTLTSAISELPAQVDALTAKLTDGALVSLDGVDTAQSILPATSSVTAAARSKLLGVDLFGGLVHLSATQASATAKAGLTRSAASSATSATLLALKVSDAFGTLLQAVASDKGITAGLLDGSLGQTLNGVTTPLVQTVDDALNTVLAQLTSLLATLDSGASLIQQGTTSSKTSADGRSVEAHAVPAQVRIGLPVAANLLTLSIGKADAVSAVSLAAPPVVTPPATTAQLPHTGLSDSTPLLALGLLGAAGAAVAVRRRTARP